MKWEVFVSCSLTISGGFLYERVLHENVLWITFSRNGEISLNSMVAGNSVRKKNGTYFLKKSPDHDFKD